MQPCSRQQPIRTMQSPDIQTKFSRQARLDDFGPSPPRDLPRAPLVRLFVDSKNTPANKASTVKPAMVDGNKQPPEQLTNHATQQPTSQRSSQPANQPTNRSINKPVKHHPTDRPTDQPADQSANQPTIQPTEQTAKPINQPPEERQQSTVNMKNILETVPSWRPS